MRKNLIKIILMVVLSLCMQLVVFCTKANAKSDGNIRLNIDNIYNRLNNKYTLYSLTDKQIAPGTSDYFDIIVDVNGIQDYSCILKLTNLENKPKNLYFVIDGRAFKNSDDITIYSGRISLKKNKIIKRIFWYWDYSSGNTDEERRANDKVDTEDGERIKNCTFKVEMTTTNLGEQDKSNNSKETSRQNALKKVQTGDDNFYMKYILLMSSIIIGIIGLFVLKSKKI